MIKELPIDKAKRNMLLAKDIISAQGQLLAYSGTLLEDKLLLHLKFYGVKTITVELDEEPTADAYVKAKTGQPSGNNIIADILSLADPSEIIAATAIKTEESANSLITATNSIKELLSSSSVVKTIVRRPIFRDFATVYAEEVKSLKSSLSDFIKRREPMEQKALLRETKELFDKVENTSEILMMLYNMRQIDDATYAHCVNVSLLCRVMGTWMDYPEADLDTLTLCGLLHDVGKTEVPTDIIKKPSALTHEEFETIKNHPVIGHKILQEQKVNKRVKLAALQHHERCDGSGYPCGLTADEIDPFAMIVAIADVYDAMTANRIYREGLCPFDVFQSLESMADGFHPHFLKLFLKNTASSYIGAEAVLSDDRTGKVYGINTNDISRPLILLKDGKIIDLSKKDDIFIEKIV